MTAVPSQYDFLNSETGPATLLEALKLFGVVETPGQASNPIIMAWAKALGLKNAYSDDSVPWCGLFVAYVVFMAEMTPVTDPLWARNWAKFGTAVNQPGLGDVLVFVRDGGGHVGFYVGEDDDYYHVLGGNQSDKVCITRIAKERCIARRRPPSGGQGRAVRMTASGPVSRNEA